MNTTLRLSLLTLTFAALAGNAAAQTQGSSPVIYPAKGQTSAQQDRDKYECHDWSRQQSGFDPMAPSSATANPNAAAMQQQAAANPSAAGMTRGALGGAAIAELADKDAGKGAAVGVLGAGFAEKARQRQAQQQQQQMAAQQQQQQQAAKSQQRATYNRAFGACLEARGYVVK